jgi:diguanylate cyclase (GGDEF)-like protein
VRLFSAAEGSDGPEDAAARGAKVSRRALLSALVLSALLWMLCLRLGMASFVHFSVKLGLWSLFAWSLVVTAYTAHTYFMVRRFGGQQPRQPDAGMVDSLTGLPSRKGLVTALEGYDLSVGELGKRVRLIDVDMANLDKVNYEYGQMVGDIVLQDIADLVRRTMPQQDLVGRLGGDEFLVIVPGATSEEASSLAKAIEKGIADYRLSLGEKGEVSGLKAVISVADYVPEKASLHETVITAKEATAHGRLAEDTSDAPTFYHVPRVTLGAFAVHRWQSLSKKDQNEFKIWQRDLTEGFIERMTDAITRMLDEKAETHWVDFVTVAPSAGGRQTPARHLAEAVAKRLGVPYRDVMRADGSGAETRAVEPAVDAVIDKGDGALLVCDVISSGILERRCVKKLSAAGAHVQVAAWSAY